MKKSYKLQLWQIVLIVIGLLFMFGPFAWDALTGSFEFFADIKLDEVFTRTGFFVIGLILLLVVGLYELLKDAKDNPKSKYSR